MDDYSQSSIYKICCNDLNVEDIYIGSTCNLKQRIMNHKNKYNSKCRNYRVYNFIRDYGGFENWSFIELENVNVENVKDLRIYERKWIDLLKPSLNTQLPTRTKHEYYKDNAEKIKKNVKQYSIDNKDKIKEYKRQYGIDNKEKLNKQNGEKIKCECGIIYTKHHRARHFRTQRHLNNLNKVAEI